MGAKNDFCLEQSVQKRLRVVVSKRTSKCLLWPGISDQLINNYSDRENCKCTLLPRYIAMHYILV